MEQWYPIVYIDFLEHVMNDMMVLRKEYALVFGPSDVMKPCQGMDHLGKGMSGNLEGE